MKTVWRWCKNNWLLLVKMVVLLVSLWFLYNKLIVNEGLKNFRITDINPGILINNPLFLLVVLLMGVNWGIEALKWKILVGRFEQIDYKTAIKSVFTGVFISLFVNILVPNRLGEFAGRIMYVKLHKVKAALISGIGSYAQFGATVLFGATAYIVFYNLYLYSAWDRVNAYLLNFAAIFITIIILLLYINIHVFSRVLAKPRFLRRFRKITAVFYFYDNKRLLKVFGLSLIRYCVFCWQFILLLWVCGVDITPGQGLMMVPIIFLVQTIVPVNTLSDLGVRGTASIYFLSFFSANDVGILAAAYLLWSINILLPGLCGAVFFAIVKYKNGTNGNNSL